MGRGGGVRGREGEGRRVGEREGGRKERIESRLNCWAITLYLHASWLI